MKSLVVIVLTIASASVAVAAFYWKQRPAIDPRFISYCNDELKNETACKCLGEKLQQSESGRALYDISRDKHAFMIFAHMQKYQEGARLAFGECLQGAL